MVAAIHSVVEPHDELRHSDAGAEVDVTGFVRTGASTAGGLEDGAVPDVEACALIRRPWVQYRSEFEVQVEGTSTGTVEPVLRGKR